RPLAGCRETKTMTPSKGWLCPPQNLDGGHSPPYSWGIPVVRIALVQQRVTADKADNLARGLAAVETAVARGARLVAFAELAFEPFYPQQPAGPGFADLAEPIPGPTTEKLAALARRLGVVIVANLYERAGDRCFDTSPVIDADGRLLSRTRMVHITDYPCFYEQGYYTP